MKLITEQIEDVQILSEEKNGKKNLYIEDCLHTVKKLEHALKQAQVKL